MALLAGSPLGLIGVQSNDTNGGFSDYNSRKRKNGEGAVSLFSGERFIRPFGAIDKEDINGSDKFNNTNSLHNDDLYDTSIVNIIDKLRGTKAELKAMDFAYLRDVGVFPNNRLMIARRFASPEADNIMYNNDNGSKSSLVTLISWKPQKDDFLEISFGEQWGDISEADFSKILDEVGKDFAGENLGGKLTAAANVLPLPGATEVLQRQILADLGIIYQNQVNVIPAGNPNIIKEAKQRKLIKAGEAGSGLNCKVSIKMTCVWEQKYIQGIDPTIAWMDILSMVGRFGTSTSQSYGISNKFGMEVKNLLNDPDKLIQRVIDALTKSLKKVIEDLKNTLKGLMGTPKTNNAIPPNESESEKVEREKQEAEKKKQEELDAANGKITESNNIITDTIGKIASTINKVISATVRKYRERIIGIINALTGLPSTPWHITIGNPMRPTFCSGDMLVGDVTVKLGPDLGFNDLPTTITADFTLTNARNWGLQEIMAKFNSGHLRVLSYAQDDKGAMGPANSTGFSILTDKRENAASGANRDLTTTPNASVPKFDIKTLQIPVSSDDKVGGDDSVINPDVFSDPIIKTEPIDNTNIV
jgi:hypothetical protein